MDSQCFCITCARRQLKNHLAGRTGFGIRGKRKNFLIGSLITCLILIVAVIAVFTPIAPLRAMEVGAFNLIIFQSDALVQIFACLVSGGLIYALNLPIFNGKVI
jgi:hypothetical protein